MDEQECNINYKAIENILFRYKDIPLRIRSLELEIKIAEHSYETLRGRSDNEITPGSRTNGINSSVESYLISKEQTIEKLRRRIKDEELNKEMVELALESLDEYETRIVTDRYFNKEVSVYAMSIKNHCSREWIYKFCNDIIISKLSKYIMIYKW